MVRGGLAVLALCAPAASFVHGPGAGTQRRASSTGGPLYAGKINGKGHSGETGWRGRGGAYSRDGRGGQTSGGPAEAANIEADGLYGPMTRAALTYWSGRTAPRPWVGSGSPRYRGLVSVERGSGSPAAEHAERTARALFRALLDPEGPAKPILERFQRTVGLTVDGKYGSQTRAALGRLGVANPPKAFRRARRRASRGSGGGGSSRRRSG